MKKISSVLIIILSCLLILSGCTGDNIENSGQNDNDGSYTTSVESSQKQEEEREPATKSEKSEQITFDYKDIPQYSGEPYVVVNNNKPFFTENDYTSTSFEKYSPHDPLGRCGAALANIGEDLMPTEERGSIGMVKPSGWHSIRYENVDGRYLYNRCHLSKNIEFDTKIQIPEDIFVDAIDICIIFGNALDNCIEACDKIENGPKKISVSIIYEDESLICKIVNTAIKSNSRFLHTTKSDNINHGFGIGNIESALEKYKNICRFKQSDTEFILSFVIFKN